jgi:hypothetical protein
MPSEHSMVFIALYRVYLGPLLTPLPSSSRTMAHDCFARQHACGEENLAVECDVERCPNQREVDHSA